MQQPTLDVTCIEAHLPIPDRNLTTHIEMKVGDATFISPPVAQGANPHWNAAGAYAISNELQTNIKFLIWDSERRELIGTAEVSVATMLQQHQLCNDEKTVMWVILEEPNPRGFSHPPKVRVSLTPHNFRHAAARRINTDYQLSVAVLHASNLGLQGFNECYVTVMVGEYTQLTRNQRADNPVWRETFKFPLKDENSDITFVVAQEGATNPYQVGSTHVSIAELLAGKPVELDLPLQFPTEDGRWENKYAELTVQIVKDHIHKPKKPQPPSDDRQTAQNPRLAGVSDIPPQGAQYVISKPVEYDEDPYEKIRREQRQAQQGEETEGPKTGNTTNEESTTVGQRAPAEPNDTSVHYNTIYDDINSRLTRLNDLQHQLRTVQKQQINDAKEAHAPKLPDKIEPIKLKSTYPTNTNPSTPAREEAATVSFVPRPPNRPPDNRLARPNAPAVDPIGDILASPPNNSGMGASIVPDLLRMQNSLQSEVNRIQDTIVGEQGATTNELWEIKQNQHNQQQIIDKLLEQNKLNKMLQGLEERQNEIALREKDEIRGITSALDDMKRTVLMKQHQDETDRQTRTMQQELAALKAELKKRKMQEAERAHKDAEKRAKEEAQRKEEEKLTSIKALQQRMEDQFRQEQALADHARLTDHRKAKAARLKDQAMSVLRPVQDIIQQQNQQMMLLQQQQMELEKQLASMDVSAITGETVSQINNVASELGKIESELGALKAGGGHHKKAHKRKLRGNGFGPSTVTAAPITVPMNSGPATIMMIPVPPGSNPELFNGAGVQQLQLGSGGSIVLPQGQVLNLNSLEGLKLPPLVQSPVVSQLYR